MDCWKCVPSASTETDWIRQGLSPEALLTWSSSCPWQDKHPAVPVAELIPVPPGIARRLKQRALGRSWGSLPRAYARGARLGVRAASRALQDKSFILQARKKDRSVYRLQYVA
jgi:hypothetical protein